MIKQMEECNGYQMMNAKKPMSIFVAAGFSLRRFTLSTKDYKLRKNREGENE
jgi:hypothetical protein